MKLKNTNSSYGLIAIAIHWVSAIVIIGLFAVGLYMVELGYYDPYRQLLPDVHRSVGILVGALFLLRVVWRWFNVQPVEVRHSKWERRAAHIVHILMYVLVFSIVMTGYLLSTADGRAVEVFDWFAVPSMGEFIENQEDLAGEVHYWLAVTLISFAIMHAAAAIKHHLIDKDNTLRRMFGLKDK